MSEYRGLKFKCVQEFESQWAAWTTETISNPLRALARTQERAIELLKLQIDEFAVKEAPSYLETIGRLKVSYHHVYLQNDTSMWRASVYSESLGNHIEVQAETQWKAYARLSRLLGVEP
jgi:hypothetical protein